MIQGAVHKLFWFVDELMDPRILGTNEHATHAVLFSSAGPVTESLQKQFIHVIFLSEITIQSNSTSMRLSEVEVLVVSNQCKCNLLSANHLSCARLYNRSIVLNSNWRFYLTLWNSLLFHSGFLLTSVVQNSLQCIVDSLDSIKKVSVERFSRL